MTASPRDAAGRALTVEEFERIPEEDAYRVELVRGRVVREPRPAALHAWVLGKLSMRLWMHVDDGRLGHVFTDVGVRLPTDPPSVRGPDLAFVAADKLPAGPPARGFLEVIPDLCVEVVSPSNTWAGIQEKVLDYLDAGVRQVWVIHPDRRTVTVYASRDSIRVLGEGDELDGADVLPGLRVQTAELFPASTSG